VTDSSRRPILLPRATHAGACCLDHDTLRALVHHLRDLARDAYLFTPPLELAARAGFELALVDALPPPEAWDGSTVFHVHVRATRERGWGDYNGLAHAALAGSGLGYLPGDIRRLALLLAVPEDSRHAGAQRIARVQQHCPYEVIEEAFAGPI
jgi:hypothetical protein